MKKVFFLLLILLSVNSSSILHAEENKKIELTGKFPTNATRSLSTPVSAVCYSDYIKVTFSRFLLDEISIRIYDEANNIVYEEIADASVQSSLLISTISLETGTYRIEFTNSQGQYLQGTFVIE